MRAFACALTLMLAACAPTPDASVSATPAAAATPKSALSGDQAIATASQAPATSSAIVPRDDLVVAAAEEAADPVTLAIDATCEVDADCAIKDLGSCCGYNPRCVNINSPTFADQVKAECAKQGRVGSCGFPAITACKCDSGRCAGVSSGPPVR